MLRCPIKFFLTNFLAGGYAKILLEREKMALQPFHQNRVKRRCRFNINNIEKLTGFHFLPRYKVQSNYSSDTTQKKENQLSI